MVKKVVKIVFVSENHKPIIDIMVVDYQFHCMTKQSCFLKIKKLLATAGPNPSFHSNF